MAVYGRVYAGGLMGGVAQLVDVESDTAKIIDPSGRTGFTDAAGIC